jgi:hypothetical protein
MDWFEIVRLVLSVIGGFAVVATRTPNSSKNTGLDYCLRAINGIGMNMGEARNR